ncbi:D-alanyl-D-alanine carboxypeptidase family protein [Ornithinibacillus contaminans]|uniref:D-alanyl-D-alanine carboxypeptidase family protein n=1 Tax=Ornithinibacillus contaminans TaxID=694055 RepID=UPI00064DC079|nr:D-alanyl-D-alanine carboxypeptidase family protein [Ornithinibacillus contaminans]
MTNNKIIHILIIGSILVSLTACNLLTNSDDAALQINENNQEQVTDNEETETTPEPEEEVITLPTEELQKGDQSDEVKELQKALAQIGYPVELSGIYDSKTVWAVTDIQLQEELTVTGIYGQDMKLVLEKILAEEIKITVGKGLPYQADKVLDDDTVLLGNPYEALALVNKQHALPEDYIPSDLVIPDVRFPFVEDVPKKQMRKVAAEALEKLFADADAEGLDLFAQSGYRSYARQDVLFASYVSVNGEEEANNFSAKPGESEHQTGLSIDVTSPHVNYELVIEFGDTEEGKWLKKHAAKYGFIIRYPEGKEDITEYQYEPWHIRYVGVKAATEIMNRGITLEEYLAEILPEQTSQN